MPDRVKLKSIVKSFYLKLLFQTGTAKFHMQKPERYTSPRKEAGLVIYFAFLAKVANLYYMILTAFKKY